MARHATTKKAVSDDADVNGTDVAVEPGDSSDLDPDGHFKFPHLWPLKFPRQDGADYGFLACPWERP